VVDGHDGGAASQRGQCADDEGASVTGPHAHPLAFTHVQPGKQDAQGLDLTPKGLVIQRAGGIDDGRAARPLAG
jgi:hypothetical protein